MDEPLGANDGPGDDIQSMQQAWINETNAPEILPYEQDLVNGLTRRLEDQVLRFLFFFWDHGWMSDLDVPLFRWR